MSVRAPSNLFDFDTISHIESNALHVFIAINVTNGGRKADHNTW
jgi:hypothetical protein